MEQVLRHASCHVAVVEDHPSDLDPRAAVVVVRALDANTRLALDLLPAFAKQLPDPPRIVVPAAAWVDRIMRERELPPRTEIVVASDEELLGDPAAFIHRDDVVVMGRPDLPSFVGLVWPEAVPLADPKCRRQITVQAYRAPERESLLFRLLTGR